MAEQKPVGHFLKAWRKHRGMTQTQLADLIDLDPSQISRIEHGRVQYSQPTLEALARALDCRPGDIINSLPDDPNAIQHLWDRLDGLSRLVLRQLMELKVNALSEGSPDPDTIQARFDRLDRSAQVRVRQIINLELGAAKSDQRG